MSELLNKFIILVSKIGSRFGEVLPETHFSVLSFRLVGYQLILYYFGKLLLSIAVLKLLIDQLTIEDTKVIVILEICRFPAEFFHLVIKIISRSYLRRN